MLPNTFKLFGSSIFRLRAYLMKVIPETRRPRYIWYLRFYQIIIMFTVIIRLGGIVG